MKAGVVALAALIAGGLAGCAAQVAPAALPQPGPPLVLPFKGRLVDAKPDEVPPAIAGALSDSSPITFSYREELSHDEYTTPLWRSAIDPRIYFGRPLGNYGVTAFASLTIADGDHVVGHYTAETRVTEDYGLNYGPTYRELDHKARIRVQRSIEDSLARDLPRVAQAIESKAARP